MKAETEHRADYREQLERLLASRVFHNADSLRRLLGYLGERSLNGTGGELKEYTVGVEAFGKSADYNPREDSSVRMQTGKLRQKLEEYYRAEGAADPVRVSFPKGGFQLLFHTESAAQLELDAPASPALPAHAEAIRKWQLCSLALAVLLAATVALAARWRTQPAAPAAEWETRAWTPEMALFWQSYLESNRPILLSLGTPLFTHVDNFVFLRDTRLHEWEEARQSELLRKLQAGLPNSAPAPNYGYTGVGEATATVLLYKSFLAGRREPQIKRSNQLSWEDIANNNLIFAGSHKYNRHLRDLPGARAFTIESGTVRNLQPAAGESATYGSLGKPPEPLAECYALVSRFPGLHGHGEITVLESPRTEGAWGSAIYLTSADHVKDLVSRLRQPSSQIAGQLSEKLPGAFQVLIKVNIQTQVPVQISYVTHRVL